MFEPKSDLQCEKGEWTAGRLCSENAMPNTCLLFHVMMDDNSNLYKMKIYILYDTVKSCTWGNNPKMLSAVNTKANIQIN